MADFMPQEENFELKLARATSGMDSMPIHDLRSYWKYIIADNWNLKQTIDFWYDRNFHGKIDPAGSAIFLSETNLKEFKRPGGTIEREMVFGADFVVDAFTDLQLYFARGRMGDRLSPSGNPNMSAPEVAKGWTSAHVVYNQYLTALYDSLVGDWFKRDERDKKVRDLTSFIKATMELLTTNNGRGFISLSGLITSRDFSNFGSGLTIELAENESHGADRDKARWIEDPNWMFYKNAAEGHGFMVDLNAPWRLVADINNDVMQRYMAGMHGKHYGVTATNIFDRYFYRSYQYDIENIQDFFIGAYNTYCHAYPSYTMTSTCGSADQISTETWLEDREPVVPDDVSSLYPNEFWLELYYFIRLRELGVPQDSEQFNRRVKKIIQVYRRFGLDKAKEYVNMKITKTRTPLIPDRER